MKRRSQVPQAIVFTAVALAAILWTLANSYAADGGPHLGTWTHWSLVPGGTINGFDPHETIADPTGLTKHVGAPAMYTSMENVCGGNCGLLYWNPTTDDFKAYCVTGGFQFSGDLNLGAPAAVAGSPNFGGGDAWAVVNGNSTHTPYMNFAGTDDLRRYNIGTPQGTGVRVNPTNGKVYVGDFGGLIIELDPSTNTLRKWTTTCKPYNLVLDPPLVYATCVASGLEPDQILRLDPTAAALNVTRWTVPGAGNFQNSVGFGIPNGITLDQDGNVWFSETTSDEVGKLDLSNDCFDEYTKATLDAPQDVSSSGSGATQQAFFTETSLGQKLSVLTVAASTPVTNCVAPTTVTIGPAVSTATFVDFTLTPRQNFITPVVTAVMSSNGNGIDRFPLPAGTANPTAITEVVFANTVYGTFQASDDVYEFVSDIIIAPPPSECENVDPRTQGFWRRVCKKDHPDQPDRSILTDELCEDLNPDPHSDPCERARSQCAATQYNVISGRLDAECTVDSTGESVADAIAEALDLIDEGTRNSCKSAQSLCAGINEGDVETP
ncbi:MAG: hypothetical protein E2O97_00675 [Acidobacteria bacterium]|nr:MAG: hypothetical protein E2O97_00675 [Acidobacteriota bacterium]